MPDYVLKFVGGQVALRWSTFLAERGGRFVELACQI